MTPIIIRRYVWIILPLLLAACVTSGGNPGPAPGCTVDACVSFDNVGVTDWEVIEVQGDAVAAVGIEPTLSLTVGNRYRIFNTGNRSSHPFALIQHGADPNDANQDMVLLAEDQTGSFEADAAVNFVLHSDGFSFTLTQALANALSGYRCQVHRGTMRGLVQTQ